jgi:hypothetical protein
MEAKVTSNSVTESAVINAPLSSIWPLLRLNEFEKFYTGIVKTDLVPSPAKTDKNIIRWTFKEGYTLDVQEEEYSVRLAISPCDSLHLTTDRTSSTPCPLTSSNASLGAFHIQVC